MVAGHPALVQQEPEQKADEDGSDDDMKIEIEKPGLTANDLKSISLQDLIELGQWAAAELECNVISDVTLSECIAVKHEFSRREQMTLWNVICRG